MRSFSTGCVEGVVPLSKLHQRAAAATTAVQSMVPSMPAAQLFEVNAETQCGDTVVIVGSVEALGNWEVHRGQRMETDETSYPLWHAWLKGCLPECEFKFVILRASGEAVWEQNTNRQLRPQTNRVAAVFGEAREVARTLASDAALFAHREQVLAGAPATLHGTTLPPRMPIPPPPRPGATSPYAQPPQLAIGASLKPFVPYNGGSLDSSPCGSHLTSHNASYSSLMRSQSHTSMARSASTHSHHSIQRHGSRISFAENLNKCF